jgi:mono/diheme cytochrome c family protein
MRNFLLGVVITLIVLGGGALLAAVTGLMSLTADQHPGRLETKIASRVLDTNMERLAPRSESPLPATDANLMEGMRFYVMNCALCHGSRDKKESVLGRSFYPPAPQLVIDPMDDPEWHIFYAAKHGIRWTGMPAWDKSANDDELWKVTMFLSRVDKLPPAVQQVIGK